MVFRTVFHRFQKSTVTYASLPRRVRQLAACAIMVSLTACAAGNQEEDRGKIGFVKGFLGGVAADDPHAARAGRDALSAGGTAADAVTAMYFMASVTMPSSASLGGGGVCIVHDHQSETTEVLDFLTKAPLQNVAGVERHVGVPMNARGFFILQSKYGDLRWGQLVAPAENKARFGVQVSRALAAELKPVANALIQDKEAARVFANKNGQPVREGDFISQLDLAATLTEIRTKGPGALYTGPFANRFVDAVKAAGGHLSKEDLRKALPVWRQTIQSQAYDYKIAHFAPPPAAAGVVGAQMWSILAEYGDFDDADEATRMHMLAEASMRAYGDRATWVQPTGQSKVKAATLVTKDRVAKLMQGMSETRHQRADTLRAVPQLTPETPSALSLAAVDRYGSGVACNVSMNNNFGVGRVAPGTGVLLSALPGLNGRGPMSLGPMLVKNPNSNEIYFVGAASRGVAAPTSLVNVAARIIMGKQDPNEAMRNPRSHHGGAPDKLYLENTVSVSDVSKLKSMGHQTTSVQGLGVVNAIACPLGIPVAPASCRAMNDPRAYGLSAGAE
ncbi:gamma-glutamyltransferase [Terasakiella sp. A23]|uniref:gamma-glutamyltransferase n=1 Tax=Terasakiella sp. FCG-A23 TaxID=3080561 RepID=UPI0029540097|nr:gamma-glutamyltransferase [Terasakiella sp. A23]MDV7339409.1 gamma-glutamyltransferase [Terasakiella sp. A23]